MKIAGIDIGTTGCKCTVFGENGEYADQSYHSYPTKRELTCHEIDISVLMEQVYQSIRDMTAKYPDISAIGVSSFGETFVCTDEAGRPLAPAMLYTDPRGDRECEELVSALGEREIAQITGLRPHQMYSIARIMWMKKNCPDIYAATKRILLMQDYVVFHLTGNAQIDYSTASRTMAFDIRKLDWSDAVIQAAGVDRELLSVPVPSGTIAGSILPDVAEKTGLRTDTAIVAAGHDQVVAAVGAGVFEKSSAVDGAGTVQCLTVVYDSLPDIDEMSKGFYSVVPYVLPGKYVTYAFSYTGGALLQWCTETLAKAEKEQAKLKNISVNRLLEETYNERYGEDTPSGLLVLPHFAGAATPYMDMGSKGAILGMSMATTTADIYRACMEGVVYEMYLNAQSLKNTGSCFKTIHATGGGARSAQWMQMKADILNVPITALKTLDAGTVGSAMLTGVAMGVFDNLVHAADCMVEETITYQPRADMHEKYMKIYPNYEKVYSCIRPLL